MDARKEDLYIVLFNVDLFDDRGIADDSVY